MDISQLGTAIAALAAAIASIAAVLKRQQPADDIEDDGEGHQRVKEGSPTETVAKAVGDAVVEVLRPELDALGQRLSHVEARTDAAEKRTSRHSEAIKRQRRRLDVITGALKAATGVDLVVPDPDPEEDSGEHDVLPAPKE